jgi:glycosyltransferase involved in cell wall biosynthesis
MNWLIIEDALKTRNGHWLEFVGTFKSGLSELGDVVEILGPQDADRPVVEELGMRAILPPSLWRRAKVSSRLHRAYDVASWLRASFRVLYKELKRLSAGSIVFVPTVGIPHLMLWWALIKSRAVAKSSRVVLFFMATPVRLSEQGCPEVWGLGGRLFFKLLRVLASDVRSGRVVLAAETQALCDALSKLSEAKFTMLPQPVRAAFDIAETTDAAPIVVGSYGPPRHEKGSDILIEAISKYLQSTDRRDVQFAVQWTEDFSLADGTKITIPQNLKSDPRFVSIDRIFGAGEYVKWLKKTSIMVLPYRNDYALRGSRVVLEAMIHGIPVLVSHRTTLARHMSRFGVGMTVPSDDISALAEGIAKVVDSCGDLRFRARGQAALAQQEFSVSNFRRLLLADFIAA